MESVVIVTKIELATAGSWSSRSSSKGIATPAFKKVSDDLAKFASGGLVGMTAIETK